MTKEYFIYKGKVYGTGTKVRMSEVFLRKHYDFYFNPEKYHNKYVLTRFEILEKQHVNLTRIRNEIYEFQYSNLFRNNNSCYSVCNFDEEIAEIVEPVYVEIVPWQQKALSNMVNQTVHPDVFGGVLLYIVVMCVAVIFVDRVLIWIFATIIFIWWLLNQYRT